MSYQDLLFEIENGTAIITLNRPNRRNALSLQLMRELIACLHDVDRNKSITAVILAAAGKVFCSGHDLSEMVGRTVGDYREIFDVCAELMMQIQSIPQPVIAEVQGSAHRTVLHHSDGSVEPFHREKAGIADAAYGGSNRRWHGSGLGIDQCRGS